MASLPPFSRRIFNYKPNVLAFARPSCLFLPPHTRSVSFERQSQKALDRMYKNMDSMNEIGPSARLQDHSTLAEEASHLLLPNTFITPPFSRRPPIFKTPKERIKFEWVRLKIKSQDIISRIIARLWYKDKFFRNDAIPTAEALHRNMYTAYARGDIDTLSQICGRDLFNTFRSRISSRPGNVKFAWRFDAYNSPSKIVSHRVGLLGLTRNDEDTVRQVVVKIDSTQSLTKGVNGKVVKGSGEPQRTTEFVVLSKRKKKDTPETPWVVWGTTSESGMEDVLAYGQPMGNQETTIAGGGSTRFG